MGDELQALRHLPYYDKIEGWFAGNPEISSIAAYTGIKVVSTANGAVVITFEPDRRFANPMGTLQGGILTTIADTAMGLAFQTTLNKSEAFATLELKVNFVRAVRDGELYFNATVLHRGRKTGLVNCEVMDATSKLVAQCSSTCMVLALD